MKQSHARELEGMGAAHAAALVQGKEASAAEQESAVQAAVAAAEGGMRATFEAQLAECRQQVAALEQGRAAGLEDAAAAQAEAVATAKAAAEEAAQTRMDAAAADHAKQLEEAVFSHFGGDLGTNYMNKLRSIHTLDPAKVGVAIADGKLLVGDLVTKSAEDVAAAL